MRQSSAAFNQRRELVDVLKDKERLRWADEMINHVVYRLYGLTEEEIKIVEGEK
jgi:hypothetical protein